MTGYTEDVILCHDVVGCDGLKLVKRPSSPEELADAFNTALDEPFARSFRIGTRNSSL